MNLFPPTFSSPAASGEIRAEPRRAWHCLRVMARREHIAAANVVQRTGLTIFSPRIRLRKPTRSGASSLTTEALFPGYIFARFHYPNEARHVASTPGVIGLVSFGGPPPVVRDEIIEQLETEVKRAGAVSATPLFEEGAWVRIVAGSFRGSEGRVLQGGSTAQRICVLMNLLGQNVQISVPAEQLTDLPDDQPFFPAGLRRSSRSTSPILP